jgi:hypothetical protein
MMCSTWKGMLSACHFTSSYVHVASIGPVNTRRRPRTNRDPAVPWPSSPPAIELTDPGTASSNMVSFERGVSMLYRPVNRHASSPATTGKGDSCSRHRGGRVRHLTSRPSEGSPKRFALTLFRQVERELGEELRLHLEHGSATKSPLDARRRRRDLPCPRWASSNNPRRSIAICT